MKLSSKLKRRFITILIAIVIVLSVISMATFAWYIYNTNAHTTNVHMAAGAGANIKISSSENGNYGQAAVLDSFVGALVPVSTNKISGGFQKVYGFSDGSESRTNVVANLFGPSESQDFYQTSLFLRSDAGNVDVYLSDVTYEDTREGDPISTAIRIGLITHKPGINQPADKEYIFEINTDKNPEGQYNTEKGYAGCVLDCTKTDGSTIEFSPYGPANYCNYNKDTGDVSLKPTSLKLANLTGPVNDNSDGTPVQIDIYIWLVGCVPDCTVNLVNTTLKNLAISFAGIRTDK